MSLKRIIPLVIALAVLRGGPDGLVVNPSRTPENGGTSRSIRDFEFCARQSSCRDLISTVSTGNNYRVFNLYLVGDDALSKSQEASFGGTVRACRLTGSRRSQARTVRKGGRK